MEYFEAENLVGLRNFVFGESTLNPRLVSSYGRRRFSTDCMIDFDLLQ
jgi:hypothetical protein